MSARPLHRAGLRGAPGRRASSAGLLAGLWAILALAAPRAASAQEFCPEGRRVAIGPALISDDDGDTALGLRGSFDLCRSAHDFSEDFPRSTFLALRVGGEVPFEDLRIPHELEASASAGLTMSLSRVNPDDDIEADYYSFHYGFLGLGARARYETSTDFEESGLAGGAELRWVDPLRAWLPSTVVVFEFVKPVRSETRELLGLDEETHRRLSVRGYWLVPLGERFRVELDGRLFRAWGLDEALEALGWDDGEWGEVTGSWLADAPLGPVTLEAVSVGWAGGRLPTAPENLKAWTVGVELGAGR